MLINDNSGGESNKHNPINKHTTQPTTQQTDMRVNREATLLINKIQCLLF